MQKDREDNYLKIRSGEMGFHEMERGLIAVWGKEAKQFLDGLITNDMKTLEDGSQMLAAFPNAQGRLLAVVNVKRDGERFLFETEPATREKVFQNLFRFTYAGDFFVEDLTDKFSSFEIFGPKEAAFGPGGSERWAGSYVFEMPYGAAYFVPVESEEGFRAYQADENGGIPISEDLYEVLRIESGVPKYGVDMDENTIVPELGLEGLISYNKGCYIGQEIIARIHFRGHVAKQLTGLLFSQCIGTPSEVELTDETGKKAGRIVSTTFSPKLDRTIALAFVRYERLTEGTDLNAGDVPASVHSLPFL